MCALLCQCACAYFAIMTFGELFDINQVSVFPFWVHAQDALVFAAELLNDNDENVELW